MARQTDGEGRTDTGTNCPTDRDGQKQDRTSGWTYITHVPASLNEDLQIVVSLSTRVFVRFGQREGVAGSARGGVAGRAREGWQGVQGSGRHWEGRTKVDCESSSAPPFYTSSPSSLGVGALHSRLATHHSKDIDQASLATDRMTARIIVRMTEKLTNRIILSNTNRITDRISDRPTN